MSTSDVHKSLPAIVATLCMAAALAPVAYAQFATPGLIAVGSFAVAIIFSTLAAAWGAAKLSEQHQLLAGLFASSGVRMVAPFVVALVIVLGRGRILPIETVYYVVPLYLCMLAADVFVWIRDGKAPKSATGASEATRSKVNGERG